MKYVGGYSFYLDLRLELSSCLKLFVNFLWIVWYHSQKKVFWHELFVWLKEHLVFICRQIHSYYVKYIRPPGVKNYTYFSLVDKRLDSYHQSLLARGPGARINLENIFDPVNSQTGRQSLCHCQNERNILCCTLYNTNTPSHLCSKIVPPHTQNVHYIYNKELSSQRCHIL